jgi:acyl-CoA thioester hydrolase
MRQEKQLLPSGVAGHPIYTCGRKLTTIVKQELSVSAPQQVLPRLLVTARSVVYPWHCDHMGHMNVMWYTGKFDEATWHLFAYIGVTPSYLRNQKRGMVAVQQDTTYKKELLAGDLVLIRSGILEMREKVIVFYHEMLNGETNKLAATTTLTGVHLNTETRKSCPFPSEILEAGRRLIMQSK